MLPSRSRLAASLLVCALSLAACSSDSGSDPEEDGRRDRAVLLLRGYGLDEEGAKCITEQLRSETVVESMDMTILASGQAFQDAAEACGR